MPERNLFQIFTNRLNETGIRYMITGAVASTIYGEPRLTHDIDLVIELGKEDVGKVVAAFPIGEFYCPPAEVISLEVGRPFRGHFNIIHYETGFKADVYLKGEDELHVWALANRKRMKIEGDSMWVAPPEYVILRKLEYYREGGSEKHLKDIASMMQLSYENIDFDHLQEKIENFGLAKEWDKVKSFNRNQT